MKIGQYPSTYLPPSRVSEARQDVVGRPNKPEGDRLSISDEARAQREEARVAEITRQVERGEYRVDLDQLARALVEGNWA